MNRNCLKRINPKSIEVEIKRRDEIELEEEAEKVEKVDSLKKQLREVKESELDVSEAPLKGAMWSYVENKKNQRWLWHAIDRVTGKVLAYVFGTRKDQVFRQLQELLEPFGINKYCTDGWGAYCRNLPSEQHEIGKRKTQRIERKHLQLRTRIKRLQRKTICFSKTEEMHDLVIGIFINRYEFSNVI